MPRPLPAHHRQHRPGDVHRPDQTGGELVVDLRRGQLLEVAAVEVRGVVDQHIDASEPLHRGLHRRLGVGRPGDVQVHDQQILGVPDRCQDSLGTPAGGHHGMTGSERGLREVDSHAPSRTGDEPDLLLRHAHSSPRQP